ncbi:MAG: DUF2116 family Zn-ribbon domain-containing protein [Euryarchaeota archaeon]|nr:DUF2116 family Zn-ribbon domain-containing protein [Euryarchaeota archaeon]
MTKALPHRHCVVCGKAIDPGETACSEACAGESGARRRRQRSLMFLFMGLMLLFLALTFLSRPAP